MLYCSRYKKNCDEALYHNCDVPSSSIDIEEQLLECIECVFCDCEEKDE